MQKDEREKEIFSFQLTHNTLFFFLVQTNGIDLKWKIIKLFHSCLEGSLCGTHAQAIGRLLIVGHVVQCVAVEFTMNQLLKIPPPQLILFFNPGEFFR